MKPWQVERILAEPAKYLDGTLRVEACISCDRNTGMGSHANLDDDDDPLDVPPFAGVWWDGDGWWELATLTDVGEDRKYGRRCDVNLEGGGEASDYGTGDIVIVDERYPELLTQ